MERIGNIYGINGSIVTVKNYMGFAMGEMVSVGGLLGEVIRIDRDKTVIQVYEETEGLKPGEQVKGLSKPLSVLLGPGMMGNIFDGIQRPLQEIERQTGSFIGGGIAIQNLDNERLWTATVLIEEGQSVTEGQIIAEIQETKSIVHKVMVPQGVNGIAVNVRQSGAYSIDTVIAEIEDNQGSRQNLTLCQTCPVRIPRAVKRRLPITRPLITGQRIFDTLFPLAKGGQAALPGGFGTGKTMSQHQLAKWSDADIIVYIGCGERGNEMTQVLEEFSALADPKTGNSLMDRTILIANTSNMPVAAREASIYTGITIAEYYRDMGYDVAIMADSTSRWAEALRELSGRLEEMPAEEGFPAYLASRLAEFYERAGCTENLNGTQGSVTVIGAVSPQGGDFSEPVTQNTKRFVRAFWTLDRSLAYARHFPAVHWLNSYSEYFGDLQEWYQENVDESFPEMRNRILQILNEEAELMEIVKLIGSDILPDSQKLILEMARVIRLGYLQQNAYHEFDTYVPLEKQAQMMSVIVALYEKSKDLVEKGIPVSILKKSPIFDDIISIKYDVPNSEPELFDGYLKKIDDYYNDMKENS